MKSARYCTRTLPFRVGCLSTVKVAARLSCDVDEGTLAYCFQIGAYQGKETELRRAHRYLLHHRRAYYSGKHLWQAGKGYHLRRAAPKCLRHHQKIVPPFETR